MNELLDYQGLVDEIKGTITESVFQSRWVLVEGYWNVGRLIRNSAAIDTFTTTSILKRLASDTSVSERTLWYALKLFDSYPNIDTLPEGKNITWTRLVTKYLPKQNQDRIEAHVHTPITICSSCGERL